MNILKDDGNEDKIKLIYEYNSSSPLFSRVAASVLKSGNIIEAIEILEKGIEQYPDYPSAYFILSLCKAYAGKVEESKNFAAKGAEIIDSKESLEYYLLQIDEISKERNSLSDGIRPSFIYDEDKIEKPKETIEERLESLAQMLTGAKISYKVEEQDDLITEIKGYNGNRIASETLANIYVSQKNFKEAIATYNELIKKEPDKTEEYQKKITEISLIIDTGLV